MSRLPRAAMAALLAVMGATVPLPGARATGVMSDNVEYVKTIPLEAGLPAGARLVDDYLYVSGLKSLSIYDVFDPLNPSLLAIAPFVPQFANEDVDTNGEVLITSSDQIRGQLHVWDVTDKTAPAEIAVLDELRDHTFSCVLDCKWAYGAGGTIVDLRDPAKPKLAGNWAPNMPPGFGFDTTEAGRGMVLTATRVIQLLDARKDVTRPKLVAQGLTPDNRLIHSVRWPRAGRDRFFLVQGETPFSQTCNDESGAFMTWDSSNWRKDRTFELVDEYRVSNGTYADGNPAVGAFGCTNMWFQEHPDFRDGGLVAAAFFEHGVRFLGVDAKGQISESGYFMPAAGNTIASYWITDEIVYAIDVQRGIDILRYSAEP